MGGHTELVSASNLLNRVDSIDSMERGLRGWMAVNVFIHVIICFLSSSNQRAIFPRGVITIGCDRIGHLLWIR